MEFLLGRLVIKIYKKVMFKKIRKRYFVVILIFFGLFLSSDIFGAVQFIADVILDLPGITAGDLYIDGNNSPTVDSFDITGNVFTVNGIVNGNIFTFEDSTDNIILRLTPNGGTANFSFSSANFSDGYISQWNTTTGIPVNYIVDVPLANTLYTIKLNGAAIPGNPFNSGALSQISFNSSGSGNFLIYIPCVDHDIWGHAYSENIDWISFSCKNCDSDDNGYIDVVCGGNNSTTLAYNYGVDIDLSLAEGNTGNLSGYAWSQNIGWISFNALEFGVCPVGTFQPNVSLTTGAVTGWVRACVVFQSGCTGALKPLSETGGWDGWIRLNGMAQNGTPYGPILNSTFSPSEFEGWAWGGDPNNDNNEAVIGYINFNGPNYAVYTNLSVNNAPTVAINPTTTDTYCFATKPPIFLNWTFSDSDGDTQSAYQIQIDNSGVGFPSPELDTGKLSSGSNIYSPDSSTNIYGTNLSFGVPTYWWRIRVWDSRDLQSTIWATSSSATHSLWPDPDFSWNPANPLAGELVTFTDATSYCAACGYQWNFGDLSPVSNLQNPTHTFGVENIYSVNLRATSAIGWCERVQSVTIGAALPLPTWNEIAPF